MECIFAELSQCPVVPVQKKKLLMFYCGLLDRRRGFNYYEVSEWSAACGLIRQHGIYSAAPYGLFK